MCRLTKVEGKTKAPFSIATTLRCKGAFFSFPWIAPLTLDLYLRMLSVKQEASPTIFLSVWYDSAWDEPQPPGPYKEDLAINNQQWLICHKTKPNQILHTGELH